MDTTIFSKTVYPITRRQILDSSKLKEFADDNFKFDENGRKLSKWVENTVGEGEIACYKQFLLFPQCFQKACFSGAQNGVILWEWVISWSLKVGLCTKKLIYPKEKIFENILGNRENAVYHHFAFSSGVFCSFNDKNR